MAPDTLLRHLLCARCCIQRVCGGSATVAALIGICCFICFARGVVCNAFAVPVQPLPPPLVAVVSRVLRCSSHRLASRLFSFRLCSALLCSVMLCASHRIASRLLAYRVCSAPRVAQRRVSLRTRSVSSDAPELRNASSQLERRSPTMKERELSA